MIKKTGFYQVMAFLWAGLIFILSSIPGDKYPKEAFDYTILAHIVEFFVLATLLAMALIKIKNQIVWSFVISLTYAASDELHQIFVPWRTADVKDFLVDALAIIVGLIFFNFVIRERWLRLSGSVRN